MDKMKQNSGSGQILFLLIITGAYVPWTREVYLCPPEEKLPAIELSRIEYY